MAKDGGFTPKAIANRMKAKGLQKLRWYCQICEKQCRDENGFKCHCASESHQRKILLVAESPEKYVNDYSSEFQRDFVKLLSTRYGTRRVHANLVYQEFIADRTHLHMNSTKWATLTEFIMHLGKEGIAAVDETPKGWFIQWVDNSPKTLARQEAIAKKERMEMDDEQREQRLIQQQIEKAAALKQQGEGEEGEEVEDTATELVRENEEEKIKLNLSIKRVGAGAGFKLGGSGIGLLKPKSLNALAKKPNPFSSKSSASTTSTTASTPSSTSSSTNHASLSLVALVDTDDNVDEEVDMAIEDGDDGGDDGDGEEEEEAKGAGNNAVIADETAEAAVEYKVNSGGDDKSGHMILQQSIGEHGMDIQDMGVVMISKPDLSDAAVFATSVVPPDLEFEAVIDESLRSSNLSPACPSFSSS
ncbi:hypothetical protein BGX27_010524 [Mortierella sp. AM989]|nr:hypothetical protein BGX27_010524 [Mortierella sp. AM989]